MSLGPEAAIATLRTTSIYQFFRAVHLRCLCSKEAAIMDPLGTSERTSKQHCFLYQGVDERG